MGQSPIDLNNPLVVSIFRHALLLTSVLWILGIGLVVLLAALATKRVFGFNLSPAGLNEPRNRTYLRWGFGSLWLMAGLLQFQPSMPLGLANDVVAPLAQGTPAWLHALMFSGIGIWNTHPVALAVAIAWLQTGFGVLLLVSNGGVGRLAGIVSAGWAALIWLIGNGAGGIFSSGSSILFGWPGATLFYVAAGLWLAVDNERFSRTFGPFVSKGLSVLLVIAALVQALPSHEFWHGGNTNALTAMSSTMAATAQPHWLAWIVNKTGIIAGTMGGGFNLIVIFWLLATAAGLWVSSRHQWHWATWSLIVGAVIIWVVGQDMAIFGGLATDANSMLPMAWLAWSAMPRRSSTPLPRRLSKEMRSSTGAVAASFAGAMVLVSIASATWSTLASAENTFYLAQNGPASSVSVPVAKFTLTDQLGAKYSLGQHRGHYTLLAFLDPVCNTDCPLIANQMKTVRSELSTNAPIDMVAIAANPLHETAVDARRFIKQHDLASMKDFYFVTSADVTLMRRTWASYGIGVQSVTTSRMSVHSDILFIIDPSGRIKWIVPDNPLSNWSGQRSAVSELLALLHQAGVH
jgi:cytochrome oxidase Cu insertion factor (SCO1/SenC/PrrC family)